MNASLLDTLIALETEMHRIETRSDPKRLGALLHPDFVEFGRSGRRYDRARIIAELQGETAFPAVRAGDFELTVLAESAALLTYRSSHVDPDGTLSRGTLRSSLWVRENGHWKVRFHQGTPAADR